MSAAVMAVAGDVEGNLALYTLSYPSLAPTLVSLYPAHTTAIQGLYALSPFLPTTPTNISFSQVCLSGARNELTF